MNERELKILSNVERHECFEDGISTSHDGPLVLFDDYSFLLNRHADLLARHNALVEAVKKYFKSERLEILKRDARAEVDSLIRE